MLLGSHFTCWYTFIIQGTTWLLVLFLCFTFSFVKIKHCKVILYLNLRVVCWLLLLCSLLKTICKCKKTTYILDKKTLLLACANFASQQHAYFSSYVCSADNTTFGYDMGWWKEEHFNASDADGDGLLNITEFNEWVSISVATFIYWAQNLEAFFLPC